MSSSDPTPSTSLFDLRPFAALARVRREGYSLADFRADLLAGIIVGIVALPLSMALAIASGVPPQHGLYTAIIAGGLTALAGGSMVQVSGPTAAFVVILAPISARFGLSGLCVATIMAGLILIAIGIAKLGKLIEFIPYPVTSGFTAGIAVVLGTLQVKDFLGLSVPVMPEHFLERTAALASALPGARWQDFSVGLLTLAILLAWPRVTRKIPAPLVGLIVAALAAEAARVWIPGFEVATIGSRFSYVSGGVIAHGIPALPPLPVLPWTLPGPGGAPGFLSWAMIRDLAGPAFAIAMLGAIESLLSAVVADGMTGDQHDPNAELIGQGLGNVVAPFFGGIAATGAIARTATNIRYGARTPFASVIHALFVLGATVALAPLLSYLPMAALAALLLVVAWNIGEAHSVLHMLRVAPRSDSLVLLTCFTLTVAFDMAVAVTAGVLLAAILFIRRMADLSSSEMLSEAHPAFHPSHASRVVIYEIAGPLFFGAAARFASALRRVRKNVRVVVLDLRAVPVMDATGLVSLEAALDRLSAGRIFVVLAGLRAQPLELLRRAGVGDGAGGLVALCPDYDEGLAVARRRLEDPGADTAAG